MSAKEILLVHPNRDIGDQIEDHLKEATQNSPRPVVVDRERNLQDARRRLQSRSYDLVITHLLLPLNSKAMPDDATRGLELLEAVRTMGKTPGILITVMPADFKLKAAISKIGYIIDIDESGNSIGRIVEAAQGLAQSDTLSITFVHQFNPDPNATQEIWVCRVGGETLEGTVVLEKRALMDLTTFSDNLKIPHLGYEQWLKNLNRVGDDLAHLLFNSNAKLAAHLKSRILDAGGVENTRLCFKVSHPVYGIALEAIFEPIFEPPQPQAEIAGFPSPQPPKQAFWMLTAPVYRRFDGGTVAGTRLPLFEQERADLNCLVIQAPTAGEVPDPKFRLPNGKPLKLEQIKSAARECRELEKLLRSDPAILGKGEVCRISDADLAGGGTFEELLRKKLIEKEWHLIHFSGHSTYCPPPNLGGEGKGYIFLPGNPIVPMEAGVFASLVRHAELVTLSSCQSAEENFVVELARNLVPAVLGFRWSVEDEVATDFFLNWFYPKLFSLRAKPGAIEKAFQQAQSEAYRNLTEETIWAAPILILSDQRIGAVA